MTTQLAEFYDYLQDAADPDGVVRKSPEDIGMLFGVRKGRMLDKADVHKMYGELFTAELITAEPDTLYPVIATAEEAVKPARSSGKPEPRGTRQRPSEAATGPRTVPRTGLDTREPRDQNEHTLAMINSKQLIRNPLLVAMVANFEIGLAGYKSGQPFHLVEKELASEYIAGKTGLDRGTARRAMADAVRLGFFVRLDEANGGRHGKNKSQYRATLPAYF